MKDATPSCCSQSRQENVTVCLLPFPRPGFVYTASALLLCTQGAIASPWQLLPPLACQTTGFAARVEPRVSPLLMFFHTQTNSGPSLRSSFHPVQATLLLCKRSHWFAPRHYLTQMSRTIWRPSCLGQPTTSKQSEPFTSATPQPLRLGDAKAAPVREHCPAICSYLKMTKEIHFMYLSHHELKITEILAEEKCIARIDSLHSLELRY